MKKFFLVFVLFCSFLYADIDRSMRNLGCLDEDPTKIDWIYPSPAPTFYFGKASVDHSPLMPPVGNQGSQGSCVAWSTAYYYKTYMLRAKNGSNWDVTNTQFQMSPSFVFNMISMGGLGAYISDGFKCLSDLGCAPLLDKPYNQSDSTNWGSDVAYAKAGAYRGDTTYSISISSDAGIDQLKNILSEGFNAVIGIHVWTEFWYGNVGADTVYDTGDKIGSDEGGHAVCIVGFDDNKLTADGYGAVKIINSWGTSWPSQGGGYFYMSYAALKDPQLCGGYAYYQVEKKDFNTNAKGTRYERYYDQKLRIRFKVTHPRRERLEVRVRFPKTGYYRDYFNWTMAPSQFFPTPNYYLSIDASDLLQYIEPYNFDDTIQVIVRDKTTDSQTGTLDAAFVECVNYGTYSRAYDLPKPIPDNGRCTTRIIIERDRTHWPAFHGFLTNEGYSNLSTSRRQFTISSTINLGSGLNTPVLADINKDGSVDIVVTANNGYVYAFTDTLLTPLWTAGPFYTNINSNAVIGDVEPNDTLDVIFNAGDSTYVLKGLNGSVSKKMRPVSVNYSSPVVSNIDGDTVFEIITVGESKTVRVFNGSTAASKWYFPSSGIYPVRTNPAIGDVDCNGIPDVVVTSVNGSVYLARRNGNSTLGTLVWSYATGDSIYSSPVIANIDSTGGNGRYEVIFGSDDGYIYVLNYDGTLKWKYNIGSKIRSTPAVCDVDNNGKKEILVGADDGILYFFDYQGNLLRTFTTSGAIRSSPVLADIDGDNIKDIILPSNDGKIYAVKFSDASLIWTVTTDGIPTTPALGDIDNDGNVDIVFGTSNGTLYVLRANIVGLPEERKQLSLVKNIYKDRVRLEYNIPESGETEITILDISGRVVDSYKNYDFEGLNQKDFRIEKNGLYFIILKNSGEVLKDKFIFIR